MEKGRRIARGARGGNRGENLLGAMESRAESEWRSPNRRMCYASWSRCATSRPPQHLRARAASWETHMARKYCSTSPTKLRNVRDSIDSRLKVAIRDCEMALRTFSKKNPFSLDFSETYNKLVLVS